MKRIMVTATAIVMLIASILMGPSAWGCDALGPDRHVGVVTEIDPAAGTFTIIDAQLQEPMTFQAEKKVLESLEKERSYIITFKMKGKRMVVKEAVPAS